MKSIFTAHWKARAFWVAFATSCFILSANAQSVHAGWEKQKWTSVARSLPADFFQTPEAKRVGDNVLLYQLNSGGWPKNIRMQATLTPEEQQKVAAAKSEVDAGTIDNGATSTEIRYLARLYKACSDKRYLQGVTDGLDYLFEAQYRNGGFPQCYPRTTGYVTEIEYNDDANVNVLLLMRSIYTDTLYNFLPKSYQRKANRSFKKGIDCILKTQVTQNGVPTVWCAQYDHRTLKPAKARAYELVSLSGDESFGILDLLMSIEKPSPKVIEAIQHGMTWVKANKIEGIRLERFRNQEGLPDIRVVACDDCEPLWARFYHIDTNEPFFCDRDGKPRQTLAEIGHERRNGYSWYSNDGNTLLKHYENWKKRNSIP